jgi:hypothetical protein
MTGRSDIASSFTIVKGAMINETFTFFSMWDGEKSKKENLDRLREKNFVGAKSDSWLRDVAKVLNRRFDPSGRDAPLVALAKAGCDLEDWKPLMLWHMTRDEFLVRDFLINWLFPQYERGSYRVRNEELHGYLQSIGKRGGKTEHPWTDATLNRVAVGLLKIASDFGLLRGGSIKEFTSFHLSEKSFMYLLHAMLDEYRSPRKVIDSQDWRLFLLRSTDVERELLRLHQFRRLQYEVAGSLVELKLPFSTASEFAERMLQ